jgi:hypothetical protein
MKRIAWILLVGVLLAGAVQAAYVEMSAPDTVTVGQILDVTGTSLGTIRPGFSTDLILYRVAGTKSEVNRTRVVFQEGGVFSASFPTDGLQAGNYLLELVDPIPGGSEAFGSDAKTQRPVTLINRQSEITITSPLTQPFTGTLLIAGSISTALNNGTQLKVDHGGATIYGPIYIATQNGVFSTQVPIPEGGIYTASFTDSLNKQYIGSVDFTVSQPVQTTAVTTVPTPVQQVSATAQASRSSPAYFEVKTNPGTVTLSTSSGVDWVMEYIDESNYHTVVNERGKVGGETAIFPAKGGTVYVKVYPFTFSDQGPVTLTASNADSVTACTGCVALFTTTPVPTATKKSPLTPFIALSAIAFAVLCLARRR